MTHNCDCVHNEAIANNVKRILQIWQFSFWLK